MGEEKGCTGQRDQEGGRSRYGLLTVKLLDTPAVVIGQHKVLCIHPLVKGRHDGRGIIGMLKAQGMAQLMHSHQKDVIPWRDGDDYEGSLGPFSQAPCFPTRGFVFTPEPACHVFHPQSHKSQGAVYSG